MLEWGDLLRGIGIIMRCDVLVCPESGTTGLGWSNTHFFP